jgi:leader peptidase (prepilin peptidase)/N-methyltransferase
VTPLVVALALGGAAWGLAADRIASRWPAHEDGTRRAPGWRTVVAVAVGCSAMGLLAARVTEPGLLAMFAAWFAVLTLLLAIDLDQRLLPDVITLPLIPIAALILVLGVNPLVRGDEALAVATAVVVPLALYLVSIPFGAGALGLGDVKLLVSVGLVEGMSRTVMGLFAGAILAGVVLAVLLVARRITLRSYVPFGPFLIIGAMWGLLVYA